MLVAWALMAVLLPIAADAACTSDFNCSLNGRCVDSVCECVSPWQGPTCGILKVSSTCGVACMEMVQVYTCVCVCVCVVCGSPYNVHMVIQQSQRHHPISVRDLLRSSSHASSFDFSLPAEWHTPMLSTWIHFRKYIAKCGTADSFTGPMDAHRCSQWTRRNSQGRPSTGGTRMYRAGAAR